MGQDPSLPDSQIHSGDVISFLNENLSQDAVVVTDVGAALLSGHYMYEQIANRRFFTSQGLGEMGFGLPSSIGAYFADKSRQLVCLNTDGALMFNLQELQVVKEHRIPLKLFVFNNFGYSMIRISQDNLFDGRLAGSSIDSGVSFPDFDRIAKAFDLGYSRINNVGELNKATSALNSSEPELIEVIMDPEQKYLPRLATNRLSDGSLISPPIEDLDPIIELSRLEEFLGYRAHDDSYKARGL
jgi:acetolactate synthase-1/2/3 large subunit